MPWTTSPRVIDLRRRSAVLDVIVGTADGFRRHLSGRNTAVLAYYGVLTLFPLLMAATTILGFVLEGRPELQDDIVDSALSQIPLIGGEIEQNSGRIDGSYWALVIGLLVALWGSLKAFVGVQIAFDDIWEIDVDDRASGAIKRVRALIGVAVIGASQVASVVLASLVGQAGLPRLGQILITLGGLALNVAVVATMYRFLTSKPVTWQIVWPGAAFTGVLYTVLQFVGANVMANTLDNAQGVYGTFAGLLALMSWLSLHALISLIGAELNAALADRAEASPAPTPA